MLSLHDMLLSGGCQMWHAKEARKSKDKDHCLPIAVAGYALRQMYQQCHGEIFLYLSDLLFETQHIETAGVEGGSWEPLSKGVSEVLLMYVSLSAVCV